MLKTWLEYKMRNQNDKKKHGIKSQPYDLDLTEWHAKNLIINTLDLDSGLNSFFLMNYQ